MQVTAETKSKEGQIGALRQVVSFGQLYLAQPSQGSDNARVTPHEARLRNLHYSCTLRVDMSRTTYTPTENEGEREEKKEREREREMGEKMRERMRRKKRDIRRREKKERLDGRGRREERERWGREKKKNLKKKK